MLPVYRGIVQGNLRDLETWIVDHWRFGILETASRHETMVHFLLHHPIHFQSEHPPTELMGQILVIEWSNGTSDVRIDYSLTKNHTKSPDTEKYRMRMEHLRDQMLGKFPEVPEATQPTARGSDEAAALAEEGQGRGTSGQQPPVRKYGKSRYSDIEKKAAVMAWEKLDKGLHPVTLAEWLDEKFGNVGGTLNVPESTFYSWRKKFKKSVEIS